jgi:hypothetical protein
MSLSRKLRMTKMPHNKSGLGLQAGHAIAKGFVD